MKTTLKLLCCAICIFLGIFFTGCNTPDPEEDLGPEEKLTIIKFSDPQYANYLIVDDNLMAMRGNRCNREFATSWREVWPDWVKETNRKPYIELTDGWYLIDWTWWQYPYGNTMLTDFTLDDYDKYLGVIQFEATESYIRGKHLFETKKISLASLILYTYPDENYPMYDIVDWWKSDTTYYDTVYHVTEYVYAGSVAGGRYIAPMEYLAEDRKCLCGEIEYADNIWNVMREHLIKVIQNGDLNNLPKVTKEQRLKLLNIEQ